MQFGIFDWVEASGRPPSEVYEHKLELAWLELFAAEVKPNLR